MTNNGTPGWYLDEHLHAGEEHLDPAYVRDYDRKAQVDPAPDLAVLRGHGLGPESTVLDMGAGTGEFSLAVAPFCGRVIAVDVSAPMLTLLRQKAAARGLRNIDTVQAGFLSYEHDGGTVDFVYTRNALHQIPDFWKALALLRIARMLKPGGILRLRDLVYSCPPEDVGAVIEPWLAAAPARPEQGWTRAELETHIRSEFSTFSWLLEPMLERAGFAIVEVEHRDTRNFSAYSCVRR